MDAVQQGADVGDADVAADLPPSPARRAISSTDTDTPSVAKHSRATCRSFSLFCRASALIGSRAALGTPGDVVVLVLRVRDGQILLTRSYFNPGQLAELLA
jgi:hypothetical protein